MREYEFFEHFAGNSGYEIYRFRGQRLVCGCDIFAVPINSNDTIRRKIGVIRILRPLEEFIPKKHNVDDFVKVVEWADCPSIHKKIMAIRASR